MQIFDVNKLMLIIVFGVLALNIHTLGFTKN